MHPGMRAAIALLACLAVACNGVGTPSSVTMPPDSAAGEIHFRLSGPSGTAIIVPAVLNGRDSVNLILDTGATLTCLDTAVAQSLKLPEQVGVMGAGVGIGGSGRMRIVKLDSISVGAASARDLTACAVDLTNVRMLSPDVRGLLGLNFLRNFRVTIDFQRNVLRLQRPAPARGRGGRATAR